MEREFLRGYNLSTQQEFRITTDENDQDSPAIYGDIVVWTDDRNGNPDIFGYNLSTGEEFQITQDLHDQVDSAIYGDIVVWTNYDNQNWDIHGYNLSTGEEFPITTRSGDRMGTAIYKDVVVWQENGDIYGCILQPLEIPETQEEKGFCLGTQLLTTLITASFLIMQKR